MDRAQWVHAFVGYMTAQGVTSEGKELNELAEELFATQGHLDPAVVGLPPVELHLKRAENTGEPDV